MFGKLFPQMFEGSLVDAGWEAIVTLQQLVILANVEGVVDKTPDWISRTTTIPLEIIAKGLAALEKPDPESRTPGEEGRRIVRVSDARSWGWRIVNYEHYRNLRKEEERRDYHRQYWREKRSPNAQPVSTETQHNSTDSTDAVSIGRSRCIGRKQKDLKPPASRLATERPSPGSNGASLEKRARLGTLYQFWKDLGGQFDSETHFTKTLAPIVDHYADDEFRAGMAASASYDLGCGYHPRIKNFASNAVRWIKEGSKRPHPAAVGA